MQTSRHLALLLGTLCFVAGCGEAAQRASQQASLVDPLKDLGRAYGNCIDSNKRGPIDWDQAEKFGLKPESRKAIEEAGYRVHWNMHYTDAVPMGWGNYLVAYPPDVAEKGGVVMFLDENVKYVEAAEAKSKLDAQKDIKPPKPQPAAH